MTDGLLLRRLDGFLDGLRVRLLNVGFLEGRLDKGLRDGIAYSVALGEEGFLLGFKVG